MKSFALITATVCLIAVPLAAQDTTLLRRPGARPGGAMVQREMGRRGDDDMMAMMREMMAPIMRIVAYTPDHLLDHKDSLQLTADQVAKLTRCRQGGARRGCRRCEDPPGCGRASIPNRGRGQHRAPGALR